jgi:hypothetical protein
MTIAPLKEGAVYSAGNRFPVQSKILGGAGVNGRGTEAVDE